MADVFHPLRLPSASLPAQSVKAISVAGKPVMYGVIVHFGHESPVSQ